MTPIDRFNAQLTIEYANFQHLSFQSNKRHGDGADPDYIYAHFLPFDAAYVEEVYLEEAKAKLSESASQQAVLSLATRLQLVEQLQGDAWLSEHAVADGREIVVVIPVDKVAPTLLADDRDNKLGAIQYLLQLCVPSELRQAVSIDVSSYLRNAGGIQGRVRGKMHFIADQDPYGYSISIQYDADALLDADEMARTKDQLRSVFSGYLKTGKSFTYAKSDDGGQEFFYLNQQGMGTLIAVLCNQLAITPETWDRLDVKSRYLHAIVTALSDTADLTAEQDVQVLSDDLAARIALASVPDDTEEPEEQLLLLLLGVANHDYAKNNIQAVSQVAVAIAKMYQLQGQLHKSLNYFRLAFVHLNAQRVFLDPSLSVQVDALLAALAVSVRDLGHEEAALQAKQSEKKQQEMQQAMQNVVSLMSGGFNLSNPFAMKEMMSGAAKLAQSVPAEKTAKQYNAEAVSRYWAGNYEGALLKFYMAKHSLSADEPGADFVNCLWSISSCLMKLDDKALALVIVRRMVKMRGSLGLAVLEKHNRRIDECEQALGLIEEDAQDAAATISEVMSPVARSVSAAGSPHLFAQSQPLSDERVDAVLNDVLEDMLIDDALTDLRA